jgi:PAS domain S-box-containing protein
MENEIRKPPLSTETGENGALRLLVVDDDESDRLAVRRLLKTSDVRTVIDEASSAHEALEHLARGKYDCVLLDYYIPGAAGHSLIEAIGEAAPDLPVVIFTGRGDEDVAVDLMKAGVADYLPKASLTLERLGASLRHAMEITRAKKASRSAERALRESEERFRRALQIETVGVVFFDPAGAITDANDAFLSMAGCSREDVAAGRLQWSDLVPPEWKSRASRAAEELEASGRTTPFELECVRPNGSRWWALSTATRLDEREGVGFVVDVTPRKLAETERERLLTLEHEARARAERAKNLRDEVLAIVAHDLRNPLHTVLASSAAMIELPLTQDERTRQLEVIRRSANTMNVLISDLLDVASIELGNLSIRHVPVPIDELLEHTAETFERRAQERGITLERDVAAELPQIIGDRDRIAQVLSNLLANALKFTPQGGRIGLRAVPVPGAVEIAIENSGSGIAPENLPHVFDRFWRADRTARAGAGLGLAIAKGIVEAHGGRIWVESIAGGMTTFHFTLPVMKDARDATS